MNMQTALDGFASLSQESRLRIVRLLIDAQPDGLAAGAISEAIGISPSQASFHFNHLERAQLIRSRREGRSIIYSANLDGLSALLRFLMEDCCGGRPELCAPAVGALFTPCCAPEKADA